VNVWFGVEIGASVGVLGPWMRGADRRVIDRWFAVTSAVAGASARRKLIEGM